VQDLKAADSLNTKPIPVDLVTASGSGLDPHISIAAAIYQASRVARTRGLTEEQVRSMIGQYTDAGRWVSRRTWSECASAQSCSR